MTLIIKHIVTSAWSQFEISLTHQISLIIIMCVIVYNVTVNLIYKPIIASLPRSRRTCPGVRLWLTLIIRHIAAYAWPQFEKSLTHRISLTGLIFLSYTRKPICQWPRIPSQPVGRVAVLYVSLYMFCWHIIYHIFSN